MTVDPGRAASSIWSATAAAASGGSVASRTDEFLGARWSMS